MPLPWDTSNSASWDLLMYGKQNGIQAAATFFQTLNQDPTEYKITPKKSS